MIDLAERYARVSAETRDLIDRLIEADLDAQAWADQLGVAYRQTDVAALLGVSPQAVSKNPRLLRLTTPRGQVGYPAFQFDGRRQVPGVGDVVEALVPVTTSTWTIASWLTSPQRDLGQRSPIDALRQGDVGPVLDAAMAFAAALVA